jgi:predicted nuclease of restriction endonuclease-like (RecB) superfamily
LEFLSIPAKSGYLEKDLETCIIQKLQQFLLQLGKGLFFCCSTKAHIYRRRKLLYRPDFLQLHFEMLR